ncbi:MAG TPA: hypothetical protein VGF26_18845 [Ramlibacter sp.]
MKIDDVVTAVRANPLRYAAWMVVLIVLSAAGYVAGHGLGIELYLFTH